MFLKIDENGNVDDPDELEDILSKTYTLQGYVSRIDPTTGQLFVLESARVSIEELELSTVSDQTGFYFIDDIPVGTYDISAVALGFESVVVQRTFRQSWFVNIALPEKPAL